MVIASMKKRLQALEAKYKIGKKLPWDCKNLFSLYQEGDLHEHCNYFFNNKVQYTHRPVYRLVIEDQRSLSPKAREFLSLSAEEQYRAVEKATTSITENEAEKIRMKILEKVRIRDGYIESFI
jgi:hypothetical protein